VDLSDLLVGLLGIVGVVLVLLALTFGHHLADLEQEFLHLSEVVSLLLEGCSVGDGVLQSLFGRFFISNLDKGFSNIEHEVIVVDVQADGLLQALESVVDSVAILEHHEGHVAPDVGVGGVKDVGLG